MPSSAFQTSALDRKSTRLNSSHTIISYAVFFLKKKRLIHNAWQNQTIDSGDVASGLLPMDGLRYTSCDPLRARAACVFFFKGGGPPQLSPLSPPPRFPL